MICSNPDCGKRLTLGKDCHFQPDGFVNTNGGSRIKRSWPLCPDCLELFKQKRGGNDRQRQR